MFNCVLEMQGAHPSPSKYLILIGFESSVNSVFSLSSIEWLLLLWSFSRLIALFHCWD